jgi:hypothetical protein
MDTRQTGFCKYASGVYKFHTPRYTIGSVLLNLKTPYIVLLGSFHEHISGGRMANNSKQTSKSVASLAGKTLQSSGASQVQRQLAASALAQSGTGKQTGASIEATASKALRSNSGSNVTQKLAGSVVSQSNRKR